MRDDPNGLYPPQDPYATTTNWKPVSAPEEAVIVTEPSVVNDGYTSLAGIYV